MWIDNEIAVPFGNPNYDTGLGGSHNMTYHCTPNTEITSLTDGTEITDISSPTWGKDVTVKLTSPINGHEYFGYQHLSAINPALRIGSILHYNDIVGWSGGCTSPGQYDGTHNPTGQNFCDSTQMSSQPQVGIALCDGAGYGYAGWKTFPPIEESLNPQPVVDAYRKAMEPPPVDYAFNQWVQQWQSIVHDADPHSGIASFAYKSYQNGVNHGIPQTPEIDGFDNEGRQYIYQILNTGIYFWYRPDTCEWHAFKG